LQSVWNIWVLIHIEYTPNSIEPEVIIFFSFGPFLRGDLKRFRVFNDRFRDSFTTFDFNPNARVLASFGEAL
jgi:hypothetical protein